MSLHSVCHCNKQLLSELIQTIEMLPSRKYQTRISDNNSQTIGAHIRHIIEFYQCFFSGLANSHIDYDDRKRDAEYEINSSSALKALARINQQLASLAKDPLTTVNLTLNACIDTEGNTLSTESSPIRELLFLQSHTTHHMAMISLLLQHSGQKPPKDLGVATSTLIYRKQQVLSSEN